MGLFCKDDCVKISACEELIFGNAILASNKNQNKIKKNP
jgi:hypothetical protein